MGEDGDGCGTRDVRLARAAAGTIEARRATPAIQIPPSRFAARSPRGAHVPTRAARGVADGRYQYPPFFLPASWKRTVARCELRASSDVFDDERPERQIARDLRRTSNSSRRASRALPLASKITMLRCDQTYVYVQ